jgi:hypothetical protein
MRLLCVLHEHLRGTDHSTVEPIKPCAATFPPPHLPHACYVNLQASEAARVRPAQAYAFRFDALPRHGQVAGTAAPEIREEKFGCVVGDDQHRVTRQHVVEPAVHWQEQRALPVHHQRCVRQGHPGPWTAR